MPKQSGIFPVEGSIGNVTFYKTEDGFLVREKGGVSKERIATDPKFARTRENNSQFGLNAKAGKLLRDSFTTALKNAKDRRVTSRVSKVMSEIAKYDHTSVRGQKKIAIALENPEARNILKGFNFNSNAPIETVLAAKYTVDSTTGIISFTGIIPEEQVKAPGGATHVSFRSGFASINFATAKTQTEYSKKALLPLNLTPATITLDPDPVLTPEPGAKLITVLLVEFYQELDGILYPLMNGAHNALSIIEIV